MLAISLKLDDEDDELALMFVFALKTGLAGSLSTVSTLVVEVAALMQSVPQHAWGYYYLFLTLVSGCILGIIFYVWAVV